jgi:hypothetical protein
VSDLPDRTGSSSGPPERLLSNRDFELVIRRAAELQARSAEEVGGEGISEAEAFRIGQELGLSPGHLQRALAEVRVSAVEEPGILTRLFGPATVRVARIVRGDASDMGPFLERYLIEREYLAVLRRFPDRTLFTRASGVIAVVGRATTQIFNRTPLLRVNNLECAIHPAEEGYCYVALASSLGTQRRGTAASTFVAGGGTTVATAAALGLAVTPPAALLALPILGISVYGGHRYYEGVMHNVQLQLESFLDRLEHGELSLSSPRRAGPRP